MLNSVSVSRYACLGAAVIALAALGGCKATPKVIDNPKNGDQISLSVGQPLTVILTDMDGPKTDWTMTAGAGTQALTSQSHDNKPADGGALPLDLYHFVGAAPGEQQLTFSYRQPGEPATVDNTMTVKVTVGKG